MQGTWEDQTMIKLEFSQRAFLARRIAAGLFAASLIALSGLATSTASAEPKDIKWGTGPVGSSGHKALVVLADLLNKEMPEFRISVLPNPGAVSTVKGFATGEYQRLLRVGRGAEGIRRGRWPLQRLQGERQDPAGAVVLVLHPRCRSRHQGERPRHHQEVGRSHRQERISPVRCRSTPASISKTPWPRSA